MSKPINLAAYYPLVANEVEASFQDERLNLSLEAEDVTPEDLAKLELCLAMFHSVYINSSATEEQDRIPYQSPGKLALNALFAAASDYFDKYPYNPPCPISRLESSHLYADGRERIFDKALKSILEQVEEVGDNGLKGMGRHL